MSSAIRTISRRNDLSVARDRSQCRKWDLIWRGLRGGMAPVRCRHASSDALLQVPPLPWPRRSDRRPLGSFPQSARRLPASAPEPGPVDSRARVEAPLVGGDVDRPAAGAWGHRYRDEWSPERLAQVTIERARRFEWDFVKFQPRATFFAEAFGAEYRPAGHSLRAPVIAEPPVEVLEDWQRLRLVNEEVMDDQVRALALVVEGLGDRVPVLQTVFSPLSVGSYLVGRENRKLVREMRANLDVVLPALNRIADALIDFSRK